MGKDLMDLGPDILNRVTLNDKNPIKILNNLGDKPPRSIKWIIRGVIPRGSCIIVGGREKSGKTYLSLDMAVAMVASQPVLIYCTPIVKGPIMLYSPEGSDEALKRRLWGLCIGRGLPPSIILKQIHIVSCNLNLLNDEHFNGLLVRVKEIEPSLLILDPLIRCYTSDNVKENDANIQGVLNRIRDLIVKPEMSILIGHHENKGDPRFKTTSFDGLRGSTAISAWADGLISVTRRADNEAETRKIQITLRDGAPVYGIGYHIEFEEREQGPGSIKLRYVST